MPFPSPLHEREKWKWSCSVVSDYSRPHGLQPTRLLCPWDFLGKSTGVGCYCLLQSLLSVYLTEKYEKWIIFVCLFVYLLPMRYMDSMPHRKQTSFFKQWGWVMWKQINGAIKIPFVLALLLFKGTTLNLHSCQPLA